MISRRSSSNRGRYGCDTKITKTRSCGIEECCIGVSVDRLRDHHRCQCGRASAQRGRPVRRRPRLRRTELSGQSGDPDAPHRFHRQERCPLHRGLCGGTQLQSLPGWSAYRSQRRRALATSSIRPGRSTNNLNSACQSEEDHDCRSAPRCWLHHWADRQMAPGRNGQVPSLPPWLR